MQWAPDKRGNCYCYIWSLKQMGTWADLKARRRAGGSGGRDGTCPCRKEAGERHNEPGNTGKE